MNGESAAFADVAAHSKLSTAEFLAFGTVNEEVRFTFFDIARHDVVTLFRGQLQIDQG